MARGYARAFTLVEIMVAIIVIGIVTSISIIGFGQWQRSITITQVKSDLNGVAGAMESHKNFNDEYPGDVSLVFSPSSGVSISGGSPDGVSYCVDASSTDRDDVEYYLAIPGEDSAAPQEGTCATRPLPPTGAPSNLAATTQSHNTIDLAWDGIGNASWYVVEVATSSDFSSASVAASPSASSVSVGSLNANTQYFFRVKAVNNKGESEWSNSANATTQYTPVTSPTIAATVNSASQITINWSAIAGAESYRLEYANNSGFSGYQTISGITATSRAVTGLSASTAYWFRVYAVNPGSTSSASNVVNATTISLVPPVILATVNSVSQITISWGAVSGATSYYIERATNSSFTTGLTTISGITGTSRAVTGLTPSTTYWFRAYASNSQGDSGVSNIVNATTQAVTVPTGVTATLDGTAGAASYTSTCGPGGVAEFRYATTHRTDGSVDDNWGGFSSWSTTASNDDFISQAQYGRVLVDARCNFGGHVSDSRYAKSAGEINQSNAGISGTISRNLPSGGLGGYATGTVTCPAGFTSRYIQLSLRSRSSGGGTAWAPSGNNRALDVSRTDSGSGTTTARTNTAKASPWTNGRLPSNGTFSDPNPTSGWPPNAHNWTSPGGHKATVLYRCINPYITWRAVISNSSGNGPGKNPLNNSNIALSIQAIDSRPAAEGNLTSY